MRVATSMSRYEMSDEPKKMTFSKFPDGIPRGSLMEISGSKRGLLLGELLYEQPDASVAWVIQGPPWVEMSTQENILERKVAASLPHISLVDADEKISEFNTFTDFETYWTLLQALRSRQFDLIITPNMPEDLERIEELHALAELTSTVVIFLNEHPCLDWSMGVVLEAQGLWPGLRKTLSPFGRKRARVKQAKLQLINGEVPINIL